MFQFQELKVPESKCGVNCIQPGVKLKLQRPTRESVLHLPPCMMSSSPWSILSERHSEVHRKQMAMVYGSPAQMDTDCSAPSALPSLPTLSSAVATAPDAQGLTRVAFFSLTSAQVESIFEL